MTLSLPPVWYGQCALPASGCPSESWLRHVPSTYHGWWSQIPVPLTPGEVLAIIAPLGLIILCRVTAVNSDDTLAPRVSRLGWRQMPPNGSLHPTGPGPQALWLGGSGWIPEFALPL